MIPKVLIMVPFSARLMASKSLGIEIPAALVDLAKSTKPDEIILEDWILEWTKFGLEVSQKASSRKEALEISANIEEAANRKFGELVQEVKDNMGTEKGQLFEEVGNQITVYESRLDTIENMTNLQNKESSFSILFQEVKDFVDPNNAQSAIYKYNELLEKVDDEEGLVRKAIRVELAKDGGIKSILTDISTKLELDKKELEMSRKSTLKGDEFEDTLKLNLENLFPGNDLSFVKLTNTTGSIKKSKKGDIILRFGEDHVLNQRPIIYEAKSDDTFFLEGDNPKTSATDYLATAMKNRGCEIGIFVMDKATAGKFPRDLTVSGDKIFVVWDENDPKTDWLLTAATYIAIGRNKPPMNEIDPDDEEAIRNVTGRLESQVIRYSEMTTMIENVQTNANNLCEKIRIGENDIVLCINEAKKTLKVLNMNATELSDFEYDDLDTESGGEEVVDEVDEEDASGEQDVESENESDDNGTESSGEESNQNDPR